MESDYANYIEIHRKKEKVERGIGNIWRGSGIPIMVAQRYYLIIVNNNRIRLLRQS
jgi:hypothetical protein